MPQRRTAALLGMLVLTAFGPAVGGLANPGLPDKPIEIGFGPQVLFDYYLVDNHWAMRFGRQVVRRAFHPPVKHPANPLIEGDGGYVNVHYDDQAGLYRMWYQTYAGDWRDQPGHPKYAVAYAESEDGIEWRRPDLGLYEWRGDKQNNICWLPDGPRGASGGYVIDASTLPEEDRRGYRYIMVYRSSSGMGLVGSRDGVHWDADGGMFINHIHSDTYNNIVYDPDRDRYILTMRAVDLYRGGREGMINAGMSRRVARLVSDELWTEWDDQPQTMLIPDETDAERGFTAYYGMGLTYADGMFWGFVWPFKFNDDIYTELFTSRDAEHYQRLPGEPRLIDMGEDGAWDDGMVFGGPRWVEVGDQWRMYYGGHDGPHGSSDRTPGIGVATIRKHGFVSLRGPEGGGVVCTRKLIWPGGDLLVNVDAADEGKMTVRVSDAMRQPILGFDHTDCVTFTGDDTAHRVQWDKRSLNELAGRVVRLEFYIENADLYTFRADERTAAADPDPAAGLMAVLGDLPCAHRGESPPTIDGKLDDWSDASATAVGEDMIQVIDDGEWDGLNDLSARVWLAWDDANLYLAADVTDDRHVQTETGRDLYLGDHLEFDFDPDYFVGVSGDFTDRQRRVGLSPGNFDDIAPEAFFWRNDDIDADAVDVRATRTDNGYRIEAAIPFEVLGFEPIGGAMAGADLRVSDTDTPGRQEAMSSFHPLDWLGRDRGRLVPMMFGR